MGAAAPRQVGALDRLVERVDGASLALARIAVGAAIAWDASWLWWAEYLELYYQLPEHHLKYAGFAWVPVPPGAWLHVLVGATTLGGLGLALGLRQRLSAAVAAAGFG